MAKIKKINVKGVDYEFAHEGVLKNSGFEVVTSLPTTNLFEGREVRFNGKKYVYSSGWKEDGAVNNTMYEANLLWGGGNLVNKYSPIDASLISELSSNIIAYPNPEGITIEYSRDGGVTWLDYNATDEQKVNIFTTEANIYCGKSKPEGLLANLGYQLRITITPFICGLYVTINKIVMKMSMNGVDGCWCSFKGLKAKEVAAGNEDDTYYDIFFEKSPLFGWPGYNVFNFKDIQTSTSVSISSQLRYYYKLRFIFGYDSLDLPSYGGLSINQLRFFGLERWDLPSNLAKFNHLYKYDWQQNAKFPAKVESKEIINFNVNNIEPTQTGSSVSKTSTWLWQYLVQAVNWLKANTVRLSDYNIHVKKLGKSLINQTQVGQITSLDNLDWYNDQVSEYEVDSSTTISILNGTTLPATVLLSCTAEQLTLNLYPISGKQYGKGSLDSLISDLQGKGFSVFVENDLDAILASGNDYLVRVKISKVPTPKAIIECYVAR